MGKDTRKAKITGEVAVMEVPNQSSVGVRTRAKTLALQRLQPTADPASYLELRSRRLEKPFVATAARAKEACKEKPNANPKSSPNASSKGSTTPGGQLAEGPVNSGSAGSVSVRSCCSKKGDASPEIEVSSRDNFLEPESGRNARETTPCNLIREPREAEMSDERPDPSTPPPPSASAAGVPLLLRPRREPFEYGLLPIPKLIFSDGTLTLGPLRDKLLGLSSPCSGCVDALALAEALQISPDLARLVLDTLASVLPSDTPDPAGTADVYDLVLFLYIQSYKRLLPKAHKDSAAVADVWPSTSAFDGYFSALSPIQLVRSNSRRSMPSQADEEAHQLSYLQKHMANILGLLAESVEGEDDESLVLTLERFEHLSFLIQISEKGGEEIPLRQAPPFFANSDPDMPAVPVPAAQVHDWLLQNIADSLEHAAEKVRVKENGPVNTSDLDVAMTDACMSHTRTQSSSSLSGTSVHNNAGYSRSQSFVEGFSKASVVKQASDIKGHSVKVLNCHDSVIYVLAPLKYATIYGCSDATVVLGAIGKAVRVEHCERVQVITAARRIRIANCRECVFFLGVNQQPLILGDNHKLQVAPFNTFYSQLEEHMAQVGIDATISRWNEPLVLGMVDPHDSLSHPAGVSDVQAESATCLDPDQFSSFLIPKWLGVESLGSTKYNPFPLPEIYKASEKKNNSVVCDIQQAIRDAQLEESRKRELACALHVHFKDWLYASGNIRQLYCLQGD